MGFQTSQLIKARHECLSTASTGLLKNMDASSPAQKAHAHEIKEKAGNKLNTSK
jgi:hypothetical protein